MVETVLALALLVALTVVVWLVMSRAGLSSVAAEGRAAAARAEADLARERETAREIEAKLRAMVDQARADVSARDVEIARLNEQASAERRRFSEREEQTRLEQTRLQNWMREREQEFKDAFGRLSGEALDKSTERFAAMAKASFESQQKQAEAEIQKRRDEVDRLVKPIGETLEQTRARLEAMEKERVQQFARIGEQMEQMVSGGAALREETSRLTKALSRPEVRGQYGEIQLRRVAELAGMVGYCDFSEQASTRDGEGVLQRPDMIVQLPNDRVIAVDAKTNTYAYLEAVNATDDAERERHLDRFARHVAEQAKKLSDKKYWSGWPGSPEFTVMFVPGDHFIDAALSRRPELLEQAALHHVILASPSTLIGLLRAVAVGWREQQVAERAGELIELGAELHDRAAVAFEHIAKLGDLLRRTTDKYNEAVGSIGTRLVPTLRKFEEVGAKSAKALPEPAEVSVVPRQGVLEG